jgi:hypothetical protein
MRYDFKDIARRRAHGEGWETIAADLGVKTPTIRGAYSRWSARCDEYMEDAELVPGDVAPPETLDPVLLGVDDLARITTLEELVEFFKVDTERWQVNNFRINKWESASVKNGIVPLYQVRATLGRNLEREAELAAESYRQALEDLRDGPIDYPPVPSYRHISGPAIDDACLLEVAAFDPHIGMYGWAQEVGEDYDSSIAVRSYTSSVERILYVVGNDLSHVDGLGEQQKGGATTAGTQQDFGIDQARTIAPVDVLIIPGNHDEQTSYKVGEVLAAWYRKDPAVRVFYDPDSDDNRMWPRRRQYYQYGQNALMFTHGMEYKRKRDPLPLLFATECPPVVWASTTHREVHTGHSHIRMSGRYQPEADVTETRAIITRSLPGLTPEDSWHYNQGYKHAKAATGLVFRRSGGLVGLHEVTPEV